MMRSYFYDRPAQTGSRSAAHRPTSCPGCAGHPQRHGRLRTWRQLRLSTQGRSVDTTNQNTASKHPEHSARPRTQLGPAVLTEEHLKQLR